MHSDTSSWIVLARLIRPQGRKGELLAELLTDFPDRFVGRENLFLAPHDFAGKPGDARPVAVTSSWLPVGKNKGRVVLHFAGTDTISDAEALVGLDVIVPREQRISLDGESVYVSDLVDCVLYDNDAKVGRVTGVEFPAAPDGSRLDDAAPLLEIESVDGGEILVPFAKTFLKTIDLEEKRIEMNLPTGLVDINR